MEIGLVFIGPTKIPQTLARLVDLLVNRTVFGNIGVLSLTIKS